MRTAAHWILNRIVEVKRDGETSANTGGASAVATLTSSDC